MTRLGGCALALAVSAAWLVGCDGGRASEHGGDAASPEADAGVAGGIDAGALADAGAADGAVADASVADASVADASVADASVDAGPLRPVSPYPVYTEAEVAAWSTSDPEYQRLANSWAGNVNRVYAAWSTQVTTAQRDVLRDESVYIKVQAVLWRADGNPARRAKVVALLDDMRAIASWEWDANEQYRLVIGWASTNLAQAAALVDYRDPDFIRFLVEVDYALMDWPGAGNWQASFADSKLAIAVYARDEALYEDAKAYFDQHLPQTAYHSAWDGTHVKPCLDANGVPSPSITVRSWGGYWGAAQVNDDYTFVDPTYVEDGFNSETIRDLGHVSMGLGAWMHAARTIRAHGDDLEPNAYQRLLAGYALHAKRTLAFKRDGVTPPPVPVMGGDTVVAQGWFGARRLFGADTPPDVDAMCADPDVKGFAAAGANHLVAKAFADGP